MQKDKPGVSASALTTYGSKHVGGRRHHYQLVTRCIDKRDPISPSQAANPLEFLSVFLKFCCVVPAEFLPAIGIVGRRVQQYARSRFRTRRTPRRALPGCSAGWCVTAGWSEHRQRAGPRPRSASLRNRRSNGRGLRVSSSLRAFASERASPRSAL